MDHRQPTIFDGHNDVLARILLDGGVSSAHTFLDGRNGHVDLPKCIEGGFGGGFFAIWVPSSRAAPLSGDSPEPTSPSWSQEAQSQDALSQDERMQRPAYNLPLDKPLDPKDALTVVMEEAAVLLQLEAIGALKICTTTAQIRECLQSGEIAAIMHIEGAEAIDDSFHSLDVLYRCGLRSIGPVWSRPTQFGEGVPFCFPSTPDIGGGLTTPGLELVRRCNQKRIMLDLSHLNEAGFWDVVKHSTQPLVATHSNVHVLCQHARNLTNAQLEAIAASGGMVGLNFATAFLREDGQMRDDVPIDQMIRHLDYMIEKLGEDCVGFGSDFDGATVPKDIASVAGLPVLRQALRVHGYNEALMVKLCHGNWLRVLEETWETS